MSAPFHRQNFFQCDNAVFDQGLSRAAFAVYALLLCIAGSKGQCYPSIRFMARKLRYGNATILRALRDLRRARLVDWDPRWDVDGDRTSHLYTVKTVGQGGCSATETPVPLQKHGVPLQKHGCSATETEQYAFGQYASNKRENPPSKDKLLEEFENGFKRKYNHPPRITARQIADWNAVRGRYDDAILRAKIAAWWDYGLPPAFRGNRTFAAFLGYFDQIPIAVPPNGADTTLSLDERRRTLLSGSPIGKTLYLEVIGEVIDPDARVRTLISARYAKDKQDAEAIIAACQDP